MGTKEKIDIYEDFLIRLAEANWDGNRNRINLLLKRLDRWFAANNMEITAAEKQEEIEKALRNL